MIFVARPADVAPSNVHIGDHHDDDNTFGASAGAIPANHA